MFKVGNGIGKPYLSIEWNNFPNRSAYMALIFIMYSFSAVKYRLFLKRFFPFGSCWNVGTLELMKYQKFAL